MNYINPPVLRNKKGLVSYLDTKSNEASSSVYDFNTVQHIPKNILPENIVDIVVTSPPYGDSRTTVAYGQFSRLANQWLEFPDASKVDKILMGGVRKADKLNSKSKSACEVIEKINKIDPKRCEDVISFFIDYESSINNIAKIMKPKTYACYVVGNRCVKGVTIPTDEITRELFEKNDFKHMETIIRNIPNKRMPSENSPSNMRGHKASTMKNEYIVICQKW